MHMVLEEPMRADGKGTCSVCGRAIAAYEGLPSELVRDSVTELIRRDHPDWRPEGVVCADDNSDKSDSAAAAQKTTVRGVVVDSAGQRSLTRD